MEKIRLSQKNKDEKAFKVIAGSLELGRNEFFNGKMH